MHSPPNSLTGGLSRWCMYLVVCDAVLVIIIIIIIDAKENSKNNFVEILQSSFYGNLAYMYQGGGGAHMGVAIYQNNQQCYSNSFIIADCGFDRNSATKGVGGGITWYSSHEPGQAQPTNYFEVCNCSFVNNEALYGSAVQINKEYHASVIGSAMLILVIDSCNFTNNNLRLVNSSTFSSVGAVSALELVYSLQVLCSLLKTTLLL